MYSGYNESISLDNLLNEIYEEVKKAEAPLLASEEKPKIKEDKPDTFIIDKSVKSTKDIAEEKIKPLVDEMMKENEEENIDEVSLFNYLIENEINEEDSSIDDGTQDEDGGDEADNQEDEEDSSTDDGTQDEDGGDEADNQEDEEDSSIDMNDEENDTESDMNNDEMSQDGEQDDNGIEEKLKNLNIINHINNSYKNLELMSSRISLYEPLNNIEKETFEYLESEIRRTLININDYLEFRAYTNDSKKNTAFLLKIKGIIESINETLKLTLKARSVNQL